MIKLTNVHYHYESYEKESGLLGSLKDFRKRKAIKETAIRSFNFEVSKGEIIGLLGPNGAGKTTLIKMMCGILQPSEGEVWCNQFQPFKKEAAYLKSIGVLMGQKSQLIWDLPPIETLNMLQVIYEIDRAIFETRLNEMMLLLDIDKKKKTPVRKLSLGERVKFELVCALIHNPALLFLDEPTIGLDITSQKNIHAFLKQVNEKHQTTIILTSHYMKDIETLANRIVIVMHGDKVKDTTIQQLKSDFTFEDTYELMFSDKIPAELQRYKQMDGTRIVFPANELRHVIEILYELPHPEIISSLTKKSAEFEDIIAQIFKDGGGMK
ncbi:ABC-2 type transport system ATP-binding protein [Paenibacillus turicensis]|uniref:ABC-2 type transport system ATP-binding protein n=1 Tax=Paenibacillus turicensis TaxID=160487 RepID=A0ABS4FSK7_9BACL|nr:ATP-binding cassette domain-containing protein [Paenibacillus turicensis]MBP1905536.1 ABC-2 type transport system ATP-binding protein [Paenibacillus turicensis]